jgi:hypothetical protein
MTVTTRDSRAADRAADHRFFTTMSVVAAVVIFAGFANTYVPKIEAGTPVPAIVHLHALVFGSWLLLFIVQAVLVMRGRVKLHQQVGTAGMALAALMLVVGTMTAVNVARLGHRGIPGVEFPDAEGFLLLNVDVTIVFAVLVAAAWWFRRKPQVHKRLMLMSTVGGLMPPGISRLPLVAGHTPAIAVLVIAFVLIGPVYDFITRRRIHPAYILGVVAAVFAFPPVAAALSGLPPWHRALVWMIG